MTTYRFHGVDDEASHCSRCGRQGLKRVVWLSHLDSDGQPDEEPAPYGCDCAGELLTGRKTTTNTRRVQDWGRRLENTRTQLHAAREHLAALAAGGALARAEHILTVSSLRKGTPAAVIADELLTDARRTVTGLTVTLADLETVEVAA